MSAKQARKKAAKKKVANQKVAALKKKSTSKRRPTRVAKPKAGPQKTPPKNEEPDLESVDVLDESLFVQDISDDYEVVPNGGYHVALEDLRQKEGAAYQNEDVTELQIMFGFGIVEGEYAGERVTFWASVERDGRRVKPTPKSNLRKISRWLTGKNDSQLDGRSIDYRDFVGCEYAAVVEEGKIISLIPQGEVPF